MEQKRGEVRESSSSDVEQRRRDGGRVTVPRTGIEVLLTSRS